MFLEILIPITLFVAIAAILWKYFEGRHRERMTIIEKGLNPADYKELYRRQESVSNPLRNLKWGLLFTFVGIGVFIGLWLDKFSALGDEFVISFMLIAGGLALLLYYRIALKKSKEQAADA
ncbi:MAG: DUF6249 domain-containing protein [Bacteroidota bacterium]